MALPTSWAQGLMLASAAALNQNVLKAVKVVVFTAVETSTKTQIKTSGKTKIELNFQAIGFRKRMLLATRRYTTRSQY